MKKIFTLIFVSLFAFAFSAGFVACKKDKPADEPTVEEQKEGEAAPAGEEKKAEEAAPAK
jgi:hypothetical protein